MRIQTADGDPVLLRPLAVSDEPALREAIESFSNRTRYMRFFSGVAAVPDPVIHMLADVDGTCHMAWVAIDETVPGGKVIGAAHIIRDNPSLSAGELAIGLVDDWQSRGVARLLIALVSAEALAKGVAAMDAYVLHENRAGRALMRALGAQSAGSDGAVSHYRVHLAQMLEQFEARDSDIPLQAVMPAIHSGSVQAAAA
ncbi:GNAT family N-acetyltransferase [Henriciella sp. AS95]|uniref:GNAT family N-acetyltransferase n=1 Tax=Henriciella sp. AS95 TaxID=3135782 RepID=UPI003172AA60